jgi:hypothetical protein
VRPQKVGEGLAAVGDLFSGQVARAPWSRSVDICSADVPGLCVRSRSPRGRGVMTLFHFAELPEHQAPPTRGSAQTGGGRASRISRYCVTDRPMLGAGQAAIDLRQIRRGNQGEWRPRQESNLRPLD